MVDFFPFFSSFPMVEQGHFWKIKKISRALERFSSFAIG
jgi:hypothetical protein